MAISELDLMLFGGAVAALAFVAGWLAALRPVKRIYEEAQQALRDIEGVRVEADAALRAMWLLHTHRGCGEPEPEERLQAPDLIDDEEWDPARRRHAPKLTEF